MRKFVGFCRNTVNTLSDTSLNMVFAPPLASVDEEEGVADASLTDFDDFCPWYAFRFVLGGASSYSLFHNRGGVRRHKQRSSEPYTGVAFAKAIVVMTRRWPLRFAATTIVAGASTLLPVVGARVCREHEIG
jgi:hypothetical protein